MNQNLIFRCANQSARHYLQWHLNTNRNLLGFQTNHHLPNAMFSYQIQSSQPFLLTSESDLTIPHLAISSATIEPLINSKIWNYLQELKQAFNHQFTIKYDHLKQNLTISKPVLIPIGKTHYEQTTLSYQIKLSSDLTKIALQLIQQIVNRVESFFTTFVDDELNHLKIKLFKIRPIGLKQPCFTIGDQDLIKTDQTKVINCYFSYYYCGIKKTKLWTKLVKQDQNLTLI